MWWWPTGRSRSPTASGARSIPRGLYKSVVALSEMHQGVLSDLLTEKLGWGWDGRSRAIPNDSALK